MMARGTPHRVAYADDLIGQKAACRSFSTSGCHAETVGERMTRPRRFRALPNCAVGEQRGQ
jgi:hypothetical protein